MQDTDTTNPQFDLAVQFVNNTAQHIFLTGKAGTGKTTFLKYIRNHTYKKLAVVAPTGIAAINAGGVTLHSFFQLPFGSFLPEATGKEIPSGNFYTRQSLFKNLRINATKRRMLQELDLLIIDEVSMVRSDLLDAVDSILKHVRKQPGTPFGGVQLLFIGDLLQLPPVINDEAWKTLMHYYASPFFFDAHVLRQSPPHYLELKKIYRQSDEVFIGLLNRLRNNQMVPADLHLLNGYYQPKFTPDNPGEYITLTSHNAKAEEINQQALKKLEGIGYTYTAEIIGEFNEKSVTAEVKLLLKEGAQIMFIRNDKGDDRRYYNGKLGTVSKLETNKIHVLFPGSTDAIEVEKETWKNIRYNYDKNTDAISEEELGTFTQYPLRLAWAITIHKSQGLTFHKAIIDAGDSFAPGQVYVALSRLTSLNGLVLHSKISSTCVNADAKALAFADSEPDQETLARQLLTGRKEYLHTQLLEVFQLHILHDVMEAFKMSMLDRRLSFLDEANALVKQLLEKLQALLKIAEKFIQQLEQLLPDAERNKYVIIKQRVEAAGKFFTEELSASIVIPLQIHIETVKKKQKIKNYLREVIELSRLFTRKKTQLEQAIRLTSGIADGLDPSALLEEMRTGVKGTQILIQEEVKKSTGGKTMRGDSKKLSLQLYKGGKAIQDIAQERGLTPATIEGHLASFISSGEIIIGELVNEDKVSRILSVIREMGDISSTMYKERLGPDFSYAEIKAVISYMKMTASKVL